MSEQALFRPFQIFWTYTTTTMTRFQTEMEPDEPKILDLNIQKRGRTSQRSPAWLGDLVVMEAQMLTGRRYAAAPHIGNSTRYDMEPMETLKKDQTLGGGGGNQRRGKLAAQVAKQPKVSGSGRY